MTSADVHWLVAFSQKAETTDRFGGTADHAGLLAAGLMGEAGSVLAELKKTRRESEAYPAYRGRMVEELGDLLWYYVRIVAMLEPTLLQELASQPSTGSPEPATSKLNLFLDLGAATGRILELVRSGADQARADERRSALLTLWNLIGRAAQEADILLPIAAESNTAKTTARWPVDRVYVALFDDSFPEEERLPRKLEVEFRDRSRNQQGIVILRCNNLNFGDRLTDNIQDPDGYRYHDIFHFAHAVYLGWSPVVRALLRLKRKSNAQLDEGEDGARAVIIEEAIAAIVFSRAKQLSFFDGLDHVDFDLLKGIAEFTRGFEVERVPFWQWETAILEGYRLFRLLKMNRGGTVHLSLAGRTLTYVAPTPS